MSCRKALHYEIGASLAMCLLIASAAHAQTAAPVKAASDSAEQSTGLAEIVVTAQRRSENLQNAAVAVDAVSGETLAKNGLTSATQLQQISPALNVSNVGGANTAFFVRGVGNFSANAYTDPATAFNYDGVYVGRPASTSGLFYDLERIEVLKGPQGTLYGRNATAGAINVLPAKPKLEELGGKIMTSFGNYNAINVQGAFNAPLGEKSALRIAGTVSRHDGYLSDGTSDENVKAIRAQILSEITPDLTVRLDADYAHVGGKGGGSYYASKVSGYDTATKRYTFVSTGFDASVGVLDPSAQAFRRGQFANQVKANLPALPTKQFADDDFYGFLIDVEYKTPIGALTIIPAFRSARLEDQHSSPGFTPYTQEKFDQSSLEVRLGGGNERFDYIAGTYYYDENIKGNYTFAQQVLSSYQDFETGTKSYAAFGRLTWKATEKLRFTGGLRYTRDKKEIDGSADSILQVCTAAACPTAPFVPLTDRPDQLPFTVPARGAPPAPVLVNGVPTGAITIRSPAVVKTNTTTEKNTYRGAIEYDIAPRSLLYGSVETGFHAGGFSLAKGRESFLPEFITAYTLGSKNRFLDNRLQLNVEAFHWKYRDQQVAHFGIDGGGGLAFFTENVGRSTINGIEVDTDFKPVEHTLLNASVQYLDAKYDSFKYDVPTSSGNPNVGCPFAAKPGNAALTTVDCSGMPAYQSPEWTITLGAQQTVPLGDYNLVFAADTQYRGERYVAFEYVPTQLAPSVWRSGASVALNHSDGWSVRAYVRNIENRRSPNSGTLFGAGNFVTLRTEAPRTFGVQLSADF